MVENIDVYNTHIEVYPYVKNEYPVIEKYYEAVDKMTGQVYPCGYIIDERKLYLPRGTPISKLQSVTGVKPKIISESDPFDRMSMEHAAIYDPRDNLQEQSIRFLKEPDHQMSLNLKTGLGKTYVTAAATTDLCIKTIVITPNEALKQQWIKTYNTMFDYRPKHLINIAGSNVIEAIMNDEVDEADVYFVNHQTLHSYLMQTNGYQFHQFFKKLKVGIKVYDESHLDFANIILIDFFTNTDRTYYLTATFDRSDKTESVCFQRAFQSVIEFGYQQSYEVSRKHVIYHIVNVNSRIDPRMKAKLMGYPGFSAVKYGHYAFFEDPTDTCYKAILGILQKTENMEGKTMIFVPLIDAADKVVERLKQDFPQKSVAAYHSKISKEDKEASEKKDIIVSTISSSGTGRDIKGLRVVINTTPVVSKVTIEQTLGRLREYAEDKDCYFFDIVDVSIPAVNWWLNSRMKKVSVLAKSIVNLNMDV